MGWFGRGSGRGCGFSGPGRIITPREGRRAGEEEGAPRRVPARGRGCGVGPGRPGRRHRKRLRRRNRRRRACRVGARAGPCPRPPGAVDRRAAPRPGGYQEPAAGDAGRDAHRRQRAGPGGSGAVPALRLAASGPVSRILQGRRLQLLGEQAPTRPSPRRSLPPGPRPRRAPRGRQYAVTGRARGEGRDPRDPRDPTS